MGYRYVLYTLGAITLFVFFLRFVVFTFQESPKYLVYRGRDEKAVEVLQNIAKTNNTTCSLTLETFEDLTNEQDSFTSSSRRPMLGEGSKQLTTSYKEKFLLELDRYKMLFSGFQMIRLTILTWLIYICDFWGFTVAGFYLPTILAFKNGAISVSLKATYASYIYIYAPGIVGVLIGSLLYKMPHVGRKWTMVISSGLMGASLFLFATVNSRASNTGINIMEYFFQSMFNSVLYGWTPEAFPAPIRGTASGVASFWGRLSGIVAPLIAQKLYAMNNGQDGHGNVNSVLYLAGGVTLGCVVFAALLPGKILGKQSL